MHNLSKRTRTVIGVVLLVPLAALSYGILTRPAPPPSDGLVEGWAVLAERDDYTGMMTSLMVDFVGISQMHQMLEQSGWEPDHIRELRDFERDSLERGLSWLAENADGDDIVLLYVFGHYGYIENWIEWDEFIAEAWEGIPSHRRLLIVDSCRAAEHTRVVRRDPAPHLTIASVDRRELAWCGLEHERLPIIGPVFTHYFSAAFNDPTADRDQDGLVSVQEAALVAQERQRAYMHDVVFAVPRFLEDYQNGDNHPEDDPEFPHVIVDDEIGTPLYLALEAYR
jgi:hypothetical protein